MGKVKLELDGLDPKSLTEKAAAVKDAMTDNANFPDATDLLNKLDADTTAANKQITAQELAQKAATQATINRDTTLEPVRQDLIAIGAHVQQVSGGDPAIIESANLGVKAGNAPIGKLGQVQNLSLTTGDNPGEVDGHWDAVRGKSNYEHQLCTSDPGVDANWKLISSSGSSKTTFEDQASGSRIWIRVRAKAPKRQNDGAWSQPATIIVP